MCDFDEIKTKIKIKTTTPKMNAILDGTCECIESRAFSYSKSTEDIHCCNNKIFHGPWAHIRSTLDYTYHKNYTEDRQRFQNAIIESLLDNVFITDVNGDICTTPTNPFIVFTAGG